MKKLKQYYKKKQDQVEKALKKYLARHRKKSIIAEIMNYSTLAGGKRFRPVLMLAIAEMLGSKAENVLPAACAVEIIHTFTLVHDDLPSMDNDDFRRGKLTAHRKYGEAYAILAGDALQAFAFELMAENTPSEVKPERILKAVSVLARSIGKDGVAKGQELDLMNEGKKISLPKLRNIHLLKTAALIEGAAEVAAILSMADKKQIGKIKKYARHLGLAFQIADDVLDETGKFEKTGKKPGSD
ncbi:MAG: polyprenyl synthetase family protein, partial [bacterium]